MLWVQAAHSAFSAFADFFSLRTKAKESKAQPPAKSHVVQGELHGGWDQDRPLPHRTTYRPSDGGYRTGAGA